MFRVPGHDSSVAGATSKVAPIGRKGHANVEGPSEEIGVRVLVRQNSLERVSDVNSGRAKGMDLRVAAQCVEVPSTRVLAKSVHGTRSSRGIRATDSGIRKVTEQRGFGA